MPSARRRRRKQRKGPTAAGSTSAPALAPTPAATPALAPAPAPAPGPAAPSSLPPAQSPSKRQHAAFPPPSPRPHSRATSLFLLLVGVVALACVLYVLVAILAFQSNQTKVTITKLGPSLSELVADEKNVLAGAGTSASTTIETKESAAGQCTGGTLNVCNSVRGCSWIASLGCVEVTTDAHGTRVRLQQHTNHFVPNSLTLPIGMQSS